MKMAALEVFKKWAYQYKIINESVTLSCENRWHLSAGKRLHQSQATYCLSCHAYNGPIRKEWLQTALCIVVRLCVYFILPPWESGSSMKLAILTGRVSYCLRWTFCERNYWFVCSKNVSFAKFTCFFPLLLFSRPFRVGCANSLTQSRGGYLHHSWPTQPMSHFFSCKTWWVVGNSASSDSIDSDPPKSRLSAPNPQLESMMFLCVKWLNLSAFHVYLARWIYFVSVQYVF